MIHRRSCKKCIEYIEELVPFVAEEGPPHACISCRRFYPDRFILKRCTHEWHADQDNYCNRCVKCGARQEIYTE